MEKQRILIWAGIALAILVGCITYYNLFSLCVVLSLKH